MDQEKMNTKKKQNQGRQKVPIKRIEKDTARQATFSKRRKGFFKKANELAVLCGVQVAALAFSPAGKLFSFTANTSLDELMHRCIANDHQGPTLHHQQKQQQQQQPWVMVGMSTDDHLGPAEMINDDDDEFWNNWLNELMTDETLNLPPLPLLGSYSHHI